MVEPGPYFRSSCKNFTERIDGLRGFEKGRTGRIRAEFLNSFKKRPLPVCAPDTLVLLVPRVTQCIIAVIPKPFGTPVFSTTRVVSQDYPGSQGFSNTSQVAVRWETYETSNCSGPPCFSQAFLSTSCSQKRCAYKVTVFPLDWNEHPDLQQGISI